MQILDLINNTLDGKEIKVDNFPDGQINIHLENLNRKDGIVTITTRLINGNDIMKLLMVADVLKRNDFIIERLNITYLYAARMDRIMTFDQPYTLSIVADLINSVGANSVFIETPHNEVKTCRLIENCVIWETLRDFNCPYCNDTITFVYPDYGAEVRFKSDIYEDGCGFVCCSKVRDPKTNLLSGFKIKEGQFKKHTKVVRVIDDLCDGGGTFCGLLPVLKDACNNIGLNPTFELVVPHLIQESAIDKLINIGYDKIITTNSYKDWNKLNNPRLEVHNCFKDEE